MKKVMKKRVKRFAGEDGSFVEDEFGLISPTGSGKSSDSTANNDDAAETTVADRNTQGLAATEQGLSPNFKRPEFVENRDYTIAPSPAKAVAKKADIEKVKADQKKSATPKVSDTSSDSLAMKSRADAALKRRIAQTKAQEAGGMEYHPELYLNPGRLGTKAVMEAAQTLARGKGAAKAAFERVEPYYMEQVAPYLKELPGRAKQLLLGEKPNFIMMKRGGAVKKMSSGGSTPKSSASSRGDGIASKGKTRGKIC